MPKKRLLSPQQEAELLRRREAGESYYSLAEAFGISIAGVGKYITRTGRRDLLRISPAGRKKLSELAKKRIERNEFQRSGVAAKKRIRKAFVRDTGWPDSLRPIDAAVLNLLVSGPKTSEQLGELLQYRPKCFDTSKLKTLLYLGYVVRYRAGTQSYTWFITLTALAVWKGKNEAQQEYEAVGRNGTTADECHGGKTASGDV